MPQLTVLLVSDDPEFAQTLMARWQGERSVPKFLLMSSPVWSESLLKACDFAVIGPGDAAALATVIRAIDAAGYPMLCVARDAGTELRDLSSRLLLVREHEGWVDTVVTLAGEVTRRLEACARAARVEHALAEVQVNATLGHYVLEMRHGLNNALTSLLGNSELLLLEPGSLSADARDQLSTIHHMALRIHEVLQRFTSLEREMKNGAKNPVCEMRPMASVPAPVISAVQPRGMS